MENAWSVNNWISSLDSASLKSQLLDEVYGCMLSWLRSCMRGTFTMLQPTGGPQPVAQPFSRSQLPRLAFFMVTLAGKCHSVLYAWTLLSSSL